MTAPTGAAQRNRLKFKEFTLERVPSGRCRARVVLQWLEMDEFIGEAEGVTSPAGELRCAAQACVKALMTAVRGEVQLELLGVKAIRAFDANVVIVSLGVPRES